MTDSAHRVLGSARHPTPTTGGPPDVAAAMANALTEAATAASLRPSQLRGVGVGSPGRIDSENGIVSHADNLPGWPASFPLGPGAAARRSARASCSATMSPSPPTAEFELGVGRPYDSLLGVFWGTGVGGGLILDGKPWHGRGGAGEIGHTVVRRRAAALHVRPPRLPRGLRRDARRWRRRRARSPTRARRRTCSSSRPSTTATASPAASGSARSSRATRVATMLIDRAVEALGAGIASAVNLLDVEAVVIGGGLGRALRRALPRPHRRGDAAAPLQRRPSAGRPRRRARRPGRRARSDAAGGIVSDGSAATGGSAPRHRKQPLPRADGDGSGDTDGLRASSRHPPMPRDERGWQVAPAPDGRGTPAADQAARRTAPAASSTSRSRCWRSTCCCRWSSTGRPRSRASRFRSARTSSRRSNAGKVKSVTTTGDSVKGTFTEKLVYPPDSKETPTTLFATQVPSFWNGSQLAARC